MLLDKKKNDGDDGEVGNDGDDDGDGVTQASHRRHTGLHYDLQNPLGPHKLTNSKVENIISVTLVRFPKDHPQSI